MGAADLRAAFNSVASPQYTATMAFMSYERSDGKEWSRLLFMGTRASGDKFEAKSELLPPGADVVLGAKQTAQRLIEEKIT